VGVGITKTFEEWELFVKDDVDNYISRLSCAPDIERKEVYLHNVMDEEGNLLSMIALRMWEASKLRETVPPGMRLGQYIYYTGSWGSLPLALTRKDLREPDVQSGAFLRFQPSGSPFSRPLQHKYPIWYFLTGPIARSDKLKALWKLNKKPLKRLAYVTGLTAIDHINRHAAVICPRKDANGYTKRCVGAAFLVKDKLAEDRLRYFKSSHFDLVSCEIILQPLFKYGKRHKVNGLTFVLTDSTLETMEDPKLAGADCEQRTGNLEYIQFPDNHMEPSLAFDGSIVLGPEEVTLRSKHLANDWSVTTYEFPRIKEGRPRSGPEYRARIEMIRRRGPVSRLAAVSNALDLSAPTDTRKRDCATDTSAPPISSGDNRHISWSDLMSRDPGAWWYQPLGISVTSHTGSSSSRTTEGSTVVHIEEVKPGESSGEDGFVVDPAGSEATIVTIKLDSRTPETVEPTRTMAAIETSNASRIEKAVSDPLDPEIHMGEGDLSLAAIDAGESSSTLTEGTDASSNTLVAGETDAPSSALENMLASILDFVLSFFLYHLQAVSDTTMGVALDLDEFDDDGNGMNGVRPL
jgi:hypothetical protein